MTNALEADRIGTMDWKHSIINVGDLVGPAWSSRRIAAVSIFWSWMLYLAFVATRLAILSFPREGLLMERHLLSVIVGAGLTTALYLSLRRLERMPIIIRLGAAVLLSVPAAALLSFVNFEFLYVIVPGPIWSGRVHNIHTFRGIFARTILEQYLMFVGWAALYTSVTSALESREAQRRASILQVETTNAQLRALRYQLNPHFIFNALNTVSALVLRGDSAGAESTVQALSQFLRLVLVDDSLNDTTVREEFEIQRLYLSVEKVRFGDRLNVRLSASDGAAEALLPPLLLQPLVENVIRHAVARTHEQVTMEIAASVVDGRLHLVVQDDGQGGHASNGHGIGLQNTEARLMARYGAAAHCRYGERQGGGFRAELALPLEKRS